MVRVVFTASLLLLARTAGAQELQNDGFVDGANVGFQVGFVSGEQAASRFVLPAPGAYRVMSVRFLFGGAATQQMITLHVYNDAAGTDTPGSEIFTQDYMVTGNDTVFHVIDLSGDSVAVTGTFRVGIQFMHNSLPSIARDADGTIAADKNFIFSTGGWIRSAAAGLQGDWILRAIVAPVGPTPDGGPQPDGGGGSGGTGGTGGGQTCHVTSECPTGQYCDRAHMTCTYDCRIDADCASNQMCTSLGQCAARPSSGGCTVETTASPAPVAVLVLVLMWVFVAAVRKS